MATIYTLDTGETVIRRVYRHWVDLASIAFLAGTMILAALALAYVYGRYRDMFTISATPSITIPGWLITILVATLLVLACLVVIVGVWVYQHNYVLITDRHLIQVEQHGLFSNEVDQVSLGRIQDVSGSRPGFWATMFGYGTVIIQSAGEQKQFVFPRMPEPQELADYILAIHEKFVQQNPGSGGESE